MYNALKSLKNTSECAFCVVLNGMEGRESRHLQEEGLKLSLNRPSLLESSWGGGGGGGYYVWPL